jgi:hypothetical protein
MENVQVLVYSEYQQCLSLLASYLIIQVYNILQLKIAAYERLKRVFKTVNKLCCVKGHSICA